VLRKKFLKKLDAIQSDFTALTVDEEQARGLEETIASLKE